jgi:hypothetical protein
VKADEAEIARTIAVLFEPGTVVELRVPSTERQGVLSGYFDDHAALTKALATSNGHYPAVYVTLNPVTPSLLARSANHVKSRAKTTTSDRDIAHRRWLLIDCDPVRPADISSSEREHEAALERARDIRLVLGEEGWPVPVMADSGNGAHLLFRIDLPNDDPSTKLVEAVLKSLAARFDDAGVKIDQTVFNAGRITKAYGTAVRKGDDIVERPHRLSRIIDVPLHLEVVRRELLERLAPCAAPTTPQPERRPRRAFQVEEWIRRHHLAAREPLSHDGGRRWVLEECPFNTAHKAPDAAVFEGADGRPGFKCFHNSCSSYGWRELREHIEGPRREERQPDRRRPEPPRILNCADVLKVEIPAEEMLFDGYALPARGATLKVGAARSGKTMLAVQEALAIARNKPLFGYYRVLEPGPVMVVEQDDPGGAASIKTILERGGIAEDVPFYLVPSLPFGFGDALLDWLKEQITKLKLRLVVLDSYTALRGPRGPGVDIVKAEQTELSRIDALAKQLGRAIEIIHHGSKGASGLDWTQAAAGTYVMAAATEAQVHMSRFADMDSAATERLVRIRGRHAADVQAVLRFRKETLDFEFLLEGGAAEHYPTIRQIQAELGRDVAFGPKELSGVMGFSRASAFRLIARLRGAGALQKRGHGQYEFVTELRLLRL